MVRWDGRDRSLDYKLSRFFIVGTGERVVQHVAGLWHVHLDRPIYGLKIFRHEASDEGSSDIVLTYARPAAPDPGLHGATKLIATSWDRPLVRRWHADPFASLRPWNEVPALFGSAPPATRPRPAPAWSRS